MTFTKQTSEVLLKDFLFKTTKSFLILTQTRCVVGRERVGMAFPHLFHVLFKMALKGPSNGYVFGCVPHLFS